MSGFASELLGQHISILAQELESKTSLCERKPNQNFNPFLFFYNIQTHRVKQREVKTNDQKIKNIQAA